MSDDRRATRTSGSTLPVRLIVAGVLLILLLVLVFQNSQTVTVSVFVWEVESRLIWMLLGVGVLGFLAGLVLPRFRR